MSGNNYINLIDSSTLVFPDYNYPPVFVPSPPNYDIKSEFTVESSDITYNVKGKIRTFSFEGSLGRITKGDNNQLSFETHISTDGLYIKDKILYADSSYKTKYVILPFSATNNKHTNTIEEYGGNYYIPIVPEGDTELNLDEPVLCIIFLYASLATDTYTYNYNIITNKLSNQSETASSGRIILSINKVINDNIDIHITKSTNIFDKTTNTLTSVVKVNNSETIDWS